MKETSVKELWSKNLDHSPANNFLISSKQILITTESPGNESSPGYLLALSPRDGKLRWQQDFEKLMIAGFQASLQDTRTPKLFVSTSSRDLLLEEVFIWSYDITGKQIWYWRDHAQTISVPGCSEELVSFTVNSETFVCLDSETGKGKLRVDLNEPASFNAPCMGNGISYIPGRGPHLQAINQNGEIQWVFEASDKSCWLDQTPVIAEQRLFVVSSKGSLAAVDTSNGSMLWQKDVGPTGRSLSPPATDGESVYVGARDGLHALSVADGRLQWSFSTGRKISAQPLINGQFIYISCEDHNFYILDAATGQAIFTHTMGNSIKLHPGLIANKDQSQIAIFVVDDGGKIAGFLQTVEKEPGEETPELGSLASTRDFDKLVLMAHRFADQGHHENAAKLFLRAGEKENAAENYELAGEWVKAADLWREINRQLEYAQALEGYAHSFSGPKETHALLWEHAMNAYSEEGERDKAKYCRQQVARYKELPILDLCVAHEGLLLNAWSELKMTVTNIGFGRASRISIQAGGEQFKGEIAASQIYFSLNPGAERDILLTIHPMHFGKRVPLRVKVFYLDSRDKEENLLEKTIYLPVAQFESDKENGRVANIFESPILPSRSVDEVLDDARQDNTQFNKNLARKLINSFKIEELEQLCFELDIKYQNLPNRDILSSLAREIIGYLDRRQRLSDLIEYCQRERPHVDW